MDRSTLKLTELTDAILSQMDASGFMESTRGFYVTLFRRLCRMAKERGDNYYTIELGQASIGDQSHVVPENTERYHHERTVAYKRCIKLVESYLATGTVDWTPALHCAAFPVESDALRTSFLKFLSELTNRELKSNTIDGYRRFTYYFIEYLEGNLVISTQIAEQLTGRSSTTAWRYLKKLVEAGVIEPDGNTNHAGYKKIVK